MKDKRFCGEVLSEAKSLLSNAGCFSACLDAGLLVEHFSKMSCAEILLSPKTTLCESTVYAIENALMRRMKGEPVYRILGKREFYGLCLELSPSTLEPRPDTETLVDAVLPFVRSFVSSRGFCRILDLGTGSGAIALALLSQEKKCTILAIDKNFMALQTALANAKKLGLDERFFVQESDWFEKIEGKFDLIVSNPPYIRRAEIPCLDRSVRDFDPYDALDGGVDGLDAYRAIEKEFKKHLTPSGIIALEIGFDQYKQVLALFEKGQKYPHRLYQDLSGKDRVILFLSKDLAEKENRYNVSFA